MPYTVTRQRQWPDGTPVSPQAQEPDVAVVVPQGADGGERMTKKRKTKVGDIVVASVPMNIGEYRNIVWPPGEPHKVRVVEIWGGHDFWRVALIEQLGSAPTGTTYGIIPSRDLVKS